MIVTPLCCVVAIALHYNTTTYQKRVKQKIQVWRGFLQKAYIYRLFEGNKIQVWRELPA